MLVVTPNDPSKWERARNELKRLRRPEDLFNYEIVQVGSFEDGILGAIFNHNVQAVVIYDGFPFHSTHDLPMLREFLLRNLRVDPASIAPGALATTLARAIKNIRPELDIYLLTDRAVETLAGSDEVAPIRRIFYDVEEVMELHLSILDGVNDRYDTPFFSNLKSYSQRPIGTFHALPVARGKSVFRSNWIRDMGQFYGINLFLAESSATTRRAGQPARAHRQHQAGPGDGGAGLRRRSAPTSSPTAPPPPTRSSCRRCCKPGDIVLVDRNCHKSHHYGFVLCRARSRCTSRPTR